MTAVTTDESAVEPSAVSAEQVVQHICGVLPKVLKREHVEASAESTLMESLGMGSTSALELVLELDAKEHQKVEELVRREMAGAYELRVPLDVSVGVGADWREAGH